MPLVVAHALLHGEGAAGSALPRGHLPPACPKARPLGSRRRRTPSFRAPRTGHAVCLPGAARRGSEGRRAVVGARCLPPPPPSRPSEAPGAPDARVESGPTRTAGRPLLCPKLREPEPPRRAGAAQRAAACGGLSSGNSLRETEGKTSRGRSAVIGLETDLKGKVSAAAVTAAQPA